MLVKVGKSQEPLDFFKAFWLLPGVYSACFDWVHLEKSGIYKTGIWIAWLEKAERILI